MADQNTTPLPSKSKTRQLTTSMFSIEGLKFLLYLGTIVVAVVVFMWTSQATQDARISINSTKIERNETRHDEHTRGATQAFEKIDRTLIAQQELMTRTRESLVRLEVAQEKLVDEVKNLSEEVKKRNP